RTFLATTTRARFRRTGRVVPMRARNRYGQHAGRSAQRAVRQGACRSARRQGSAVAACRVLAAACCLLCAATGAAHATTASLQPGPEGKAEDTSIENGLGPAGDSPRLRIYSGSIRNLGPKILLRFVLPPLSSTTSLSRAELQLYLVSGATSETFALFP